MKLQRTVTDFGADQSFAKSAEKIKEHYGIELPMSAIQRITYKHGAAMEEERNSEMESALPEGGTNTVVGGMDGCMLPIVTIKPIENDQSPRDGRKRREVGWRESRLSVARDIDKVEGRYAATMGSPEEAADLLVDCMIKAGAGKSTRLHSMGDGAVWIVNRIQERFEGKATFLLDFYHLSKYLIAAEDVIVGSEHKHWWRRTQQARVKENRIDEVLDELEAHCESHDVQQCSLRNNSSDQKGCPAGICKRYIKNRLDQLDYKGAIEAGLPIGTGEVEGNHDSVIKGRVKPGGAWWLIPNIQKVLSLRTNRKNKEWDSYWTKRRQAAA